MADFQFIEAKFKFNHAYPESRYKVNVIVHRDDVGYAIEKLVTFGYVLQYVPDSVNVTCIMDASLIHQFLLYKPRFAFNGVPGSFI